MIDEIMNEDEETNNDDMGTEGETEEGTEEPTEEAEETM